MVPEYELHWIDWTKAYFSKKRFVGYEATARYQSYCNQTIRIYLFTKVDEIIAVNRIRYIPTLNKTDKYIKLKTGLKILIGMVIIYR